MKDVLVTCPPMLGKLDSLKEFAEQRNLQLHPAHVIQTLSESVLVDILPNYDGWIIGDDPATRVVFEAASKGRLKAAVKWGVGVDNVDLAACRALNIPISNTPSMFGSEVADLAMSYITALARETFVIHMGVLAGHWPKPRGISLKNKTLGLVGFGDIGRNLAKRAHAAEMKIIVYDPDFKRDTSLAIDSSTQWPDRLRHCDFICFTCSLSEKNRHMLDKNVLKKTMPGVRIVNVARGPLIDENALIEALDSGQVHSVALDVFEMEPLPSQSKLRDFENCIFGSHNGSNTEDAVLRASEKAIEMLHEFLTDGAPGHGAARL